MAGDLTNFPVLVSLSSDADLAARARDDGWDIVFASADGMEQYSHEIESFDGATGQLVAWVNVPDLSSTIDTVIRMYYGNSGVTGSEANPTGVWDNHSKGVWHLADDPSLSTDGDCGGGTSEVCDSTANNADGDSLGSMTSTDLVASKINGGYELDGNDDTVDTADSPFDFTGDFTLSAWVDRTPGGTASRHIINKRSGMGGGGGFSLAVGNLGEVYCQTDDGSTRIESYTPQGVVGDFTGGQFVVAIRSGTTCRIYVNNTEMTSVYATHTTLLANDNNLRLGSNANNTEYWVGYLDELRVSDTARSVAWIATEYNNQDRPSTFYSLGTETANSCSPASTIDPLLTTFYWYDDTTPLTYMAYQTGPSGTAASATDTTVNFYSDVWPAGWGISASVMNTIAFWADANNRTFTVNVYGGSTLIGTLTQTADTTGIEGQAFFVTTTGYTFATGERLRVEFIVPANMTLYWDGPYWESVFRFYNPIIEP